MNIDKLLQYQWKRGKISDTFYFYREVSRGSFFSLAQGKRLIKVALRKDYTLEVDGVDIPVTEVTNQQKEELYEELVRREQETAIQKLRGF